MPTVKLASLPNSRIKPRPSTTFRDTSNVTIIGGATTLVLPANTNRTVATVRNTSSTLIGYLGYTIADAQSPDGFELGPNEAYDIDTPQTVYIDNRNGAPITISVDEGQG